MNKIVVAALICLSGGVILTSVGLCGIGFNLNRLNGKDNLKTYSYTYNPNEIENLYLDIPFGKVTIKPSLTDENINVNLVTVDDYYIDVNIIDNSLNIDSDDNNIFSYNWFDLFHGLKTHLELEITYPSKYKFSNVDLFLSAGELEVNDLNARFIKTKVQAGELTFNNCYSDTILIENQAGKTNVNHSEFNKIDMRLSAGSLNMDYISFSTLDFNISAGSLSSRIDSSLIEYNVDIGVSAGSCNLNNQRVNSEKYIRGNISAGSATFTFLK